MRNYSYTHLDLAEKGYVSVPVRHDGVPLVNHFLKAEQPFAWRTIEKWCEKFPDAPVALVCGKADVYALDFDIDDWDVANKMREQLTVYSDHFSIRQVIGQGSSRFAIVFRANQTLLDFSNGSSAKYKLEDGTLNQIELIGNRLITIDGTHRKSGGIYHWDYPIWLEHPQDLPALGISHVKEIFTVFKQLMDGKGFECKRETMSFSKHKRDEVVLNPFDLVKLNKSYSEDEIDAMIATIDGSDRDEWISVGMAIHSQYNGSVAGFRKWDEWSSGFDGYVDTEDCKRTWQSFHADGGVTMGTIRHKTKVKENTGIAADSNETPMDFALNNYVLIDGTRVGNLSKRVNESILPLQSMKNMKSNVQVPVKAFDKDGNPYTKYVPLIKAWMEHDDRKYAHSTEYIPSTTRLIDGGSFDGGYRGEPYYNTYVPPVVEKTDERYLVGYFLEHIDYMFNSDPEWVVNWLAQIVQQPEQRYRTILYSIATHTGTGRGWLAELLSLLYGIDNVKTIGSMAILADASAKNGYLDGSVLLVINETDAPGKMRYKVGDRLKTMVSDKRQQVDVKYGKQTYNQQIYTRVFMQSNSIGNLVVDHNDNRIQPFININPPKPKEYYVRLYNLLQNPEFLNQVHSYLMEYPLRTKDLSEAYMSDEKKLVIESNTSDTASAFYEFVSVVGVHTFTSRQLNHALSKRFTGGGFDDDDGIINKRELRHLIHEKVTFTETITMNGVQVKVFAFQTNDKMSWSVKDIVSDTKLTEKLIQKHYGD